MMPRTVTAPRGARLAPDVRYVCKLCGAESPRGVGYVIGTIQPLPAPAPDCPNDHA